MAEMAQPGFIGAFAAWDAAISRAEQAERQRDEAYERMRFLLDQIERGNLTDDYGHNFNMNKAYCDAVAFMKEV